MAVSVPLPKPFPRAQALGEGFSPNQVRALLEAGLWLRLRRGWYVDSLAFDVGGARVRHALAVEAARLAVPGSVGSHESSAVLHQIALWPNLDEAVHLSRPGRSRRVASRMGAPLQLHDAQVPPQHRVRTAGTVVSSAARCIAELASTREVMSACISAEAALNARLVTPAQLAAAALDFTGMKNVQEVLRIAGPEGESVLETVSWVRFHEYGVELPHRQRTLCDHRGPVGRVDFWWEKAKLHRRR